MAIQPPSSQNDPSPLHRSYTVTSGSVVFANRVTRATMHEESKMRDAMNAAIAGHSLL